MFIYIYIYIYLFIHAFIVYLILTILGHLYYSNEQVINTGLHAGTLEILLYIKFFGADLRYRQSYHKRKGLDLSRNRMDYFVVIYFIFNKVS